MTTARIPKFRRDELTVREMLLASDAAKGDISCCVELLVSRLDPSEKIRKDDILKMPVSVFTTMCNEMGRCIPQAEETALDAWRCALDMTDDDGDDGEEESER